MSRALSQIVITGVGVVTPLGHTPEALFDALLDGQSAIGPPAKFDTGPFPCKVGARVSNFKARDWVTQRKSLKLMSDAVRFGLAGLKRAYTDAGLQADEVDPERLGLFVGAGTSMGRTEDLLPAIKASYRDGQFDPAAFGEEGMHGINPLWLLKGLSNNVLGFGTVELDAQGINQNYCNSGVGGLQAIGEAAWALVEGKADVLIAGASDSAVNALHYIGFGRLRALTSGLDDRAVRPFDERHDGFAPAEGAAFFVLETEAHARSRGATIKARLAGYGDGCGARSLVVGDLGVISAACHRALNRAGWTPDDVDLIYAHGNGTAAFDRREAEAYGRVFGQSTPPVTSNKGQIGHTIAAGGPISVACAIEASRRGLIPAIPGVETLDPICAHLDVVMGEARQRRVEKALIHAAGLGAQTTFLALEFDA